MSVRERMVRLCAGGGHEHLCDGKVSTILARWRSTPPHLQTAITPSVLNARLSTGVRIRREHFGAVAYVPRRDHFFALDADHAVLAQRLSARGAHRIEGRQRELAVALAEIGICVTDPPTAQRAFFGRSVIGRIGDLPTCRLPLVVNCFATSHCPLRCGYCHADDLMTGYRDRENPHWLRRVMRVAAATPAMVGVVTGGEPLSRPDRAEQLITALARDKAVVLDTSGVGDFPRLVPLLREVGAHVRVSLDSADQRVNDALRPTSRRYVPAGTSSHRYALDTLRRAVQADIPCSVQTVVNSRNGELTGLLQLRDILLGLGVNTWVLHVVVSAGKAATRPGSSLLSGPGTLGILDDLVTQAAADNAAIDIRVTSTHRTPNSVLLISAQGELAVENPAGGGKHTLVVPRLFARRAVTHQFARHIDGHGHASRYLNGTLTEYQDRTGAVLPRP